MSIKGTLNADQLVLGRLSADWMKRPPGPSISAVGALVDTKSGETRSYVSGEGIRWSDETAKLLQQLRESMERDIAKVHMKGVEPGVATETKGLQLGPPAGLGEHLRASDDEPPSV